MFWRFIESVSVCIVVEGSWAKNACLLFMRFLCIRILKLLSVFFLILRYLHFLFQDEEKALNTLQTNAQDLEQIRRSRGRLARDYLAEMRSFTERAGVKVSHFYNCCLVGLIDLA